MFQFSIFLPNEWAACTIMFTLYYLPSPTEDKNTKILNKYGLGNQCGITVKLVISEIVEFIDALDNQD